MRDGLEFMRLLTQAHLDLRAAREQPRHDVTDAGGNARTSCEDGHERTRVMIYGPVRTTRIAYRRRGKENLYPQDAELNWGEHAYSAGIVARSPTETASTFFHILGADRSGELRQALCGGFEVCGAETLADASVNGGEEMTRFLRPVLVLP